MTARARPPSAVQYEPLRASVFDAFAQLGAFDDDSGIVEWIFPDFQQEKELQRSRIKLPEEVQLSEPSQPETSVRKSRFNFGLRSRSKSRSRAKKDKSDAPATPTRKPKKTRSSPDLREDTKDSDAPQTPTISSPKKQTAASGASPEQKSRRLSIFPRRAAANSLDQPRPSISDEEWQQITITGSIADYQEANPFLGTDPNGTANDGKHVRSSRFSKFTSGFARSTPTSPLRAETMPPADSKVDQSAAGEATTPTGESTPTGRTAPTPTAPIVDPDASHTTQHPNPSTSTDPGAPAGPNTASDPDSESQTAETEDANAGSDAESTVEAAHAADDDDTLETTSQMDHVRHSLSGISEGDYSESSTFSNRYSRQSQALVEESVPAAPS